MVSFKDFQIGIKSLSFDVTNYLVRDNHVVFEKL